MHYGREPFGFAGVRHCRYGLPIVASGAALNCGLTAAAARHTVLTVVVLAMLFVPLKLAGTSLSPTPASLMVL